jgi:hypothetical protein
MSKYRNNPYCDNETTQERHNKSEEYEEETDSELDDKDLTSPAKILNEGTYRTGELLNNSYNE